MGTNYYIRKEKFMKCDKCGRGEEYEEVHLGKNSLGWKFTCASGDGRFHTFKELKKFVEENEDFIYDEQGKNLSPDDFFNLVASNQEKQAKTSPVSAEMHQHSYVPLYYALMSLFTEYLMLLCTYFRDGK